jgi:hypothetical protein
MHPFILGSLVEDVFGTYARKETTNLVEVYVKCSVETCTERGESSASGMACFNTSVAEQVTTVHS